MGNPALPFFNRMEYVCIMNKKHYTLEELAATTQSKLIGNSKHEISNVADLENASENDASFLANPRYIQAMKQSKAGVIFIDQEAPQEPGKNYLLSDNPSKAFQQVIDLLRPKKDSTGFKGIHPTAVIHPDAQIGDGAIVGPNAVIDIGAKIGRNSIIGAGCYVGCETVIGDDCLLYPRVVIRENCAIGNRVIIQPGAVIGSCGFGYITEHGKHIKLNQMGSVIIEDDVEIGANATIDRARFQNTVIGKGSKIDNLVQIGHGVRVGQHNIIVAQTGIAGSTTTGKYVVLAGQVAVAGHLHLDDMVTVAGKSGVSKSLPAGKYGGIPAMKLEDYNRNQVFLRNIEKYVKQIGELEKRIGALETK